MGKTQLPINLRQVGVLLRKEFVHGAKSFFFVLALVVPLVLTLILSLIFGTLLSDKPKLGLMDQGGSELVVRIAALDSLIFKEYQSAEQLREAAASGAVDLGIVLPPEFDNQVKRGERVELSAFIWGESLLKHRTTLGTTLVFLIREMSGAETPVEILSTTLGDGGSVPWEERLLPLLVLLAIVLGGALVPAASLVDEKQRRTLVALVTTPASLGDVLVAKGLMGGAISLLMGTLTLMMNRAFGSQPWLLLLLLGLSATMAATFGLLLGALMKDYDTLFTTVKAIGILLYAPGIVYLFPQIPEWVGRLFPTYYMVAPIVQVTLRGATWVDIARDVLVLIGLILVLILGVAVVARRVREREI